MDRPPTFDTDRHARPWFAIACAALVAAVAIGFACERSTARQVLVGDFDRPTAAARDGVVRLPPVLVIGKREIAAADERGRARG
jgi:hypothetical protein